MKYFWLILTVTAVGWYIIVATYVAFKGVNDIKEMLKRISMRKDGTNGSTS